jgi:hypothetical protein
MCISVYKSRNMMWQTQNLMKPRLTMLGFTISPPLYYVISMACTLYSGIYTYRKWIWPHSKLPGFEQKGGKHMWTHWPGIVGSGGQSACSLSFMQKHLQYSSLRTARRHKDTLLNFSIIFSCIFRRKRTSSVAARIIISDKGLHFQKFGSYKIH